MRHFEDAAHIIAAAPDLPVLADYADVSALVDEMVTERQIGERPVASDPAFAPGDADRWQAIRRAHAAIGPMFWGKRIELDAACEMIRAWIASELDGS